MRSLRSSKTLVDDDRRIVEVTEGHKYGPPEDAKSTPEMFGRRKVKYEARDLM